MLLIKVPANIREDYDDSTGEFIYTIVEKEQILALEHSLVALSKWESKWCKSFLSNKEKSREEITDYVRCMTITQNVNPEVYDRLSKENVEQIRQYIEAPMTATYFSEDKSSKKNNEVVTSELIYYWMIALNIPFECQKWHINRLLTLIRVCNIKNQPPKKRSRREILSSNAALNAARRKKLNSRG